MMKKEYLEPKIIVNLLIADKSIAYSVSSTDTTQDPDDEGIWTPDLGKKP